MTEPYPGDCTLIYSPGIVSSDDAFGRLPIMNVSWCVRQNIVQLWRTLYSKVRNCMSSFTINLPSASIAHHYLYHCSLRLISQICHFDFSSIAVRKAVVGPDHFR